MRLLYGTYNPAKLKSMRDLLEPLGIGLIGLSELENPPEEAEENGDTPLENAIAKAIAYRDITGMTTLSVDNGLYIEGLPEAEQPGVHARRCLGKRMDDEEMIAYYAAIATRMGGQATAQYRNALCIAFADGRLVSRFDDTVASKPFYLTDKPLEERTVGFPLDSLSVDPESGEYYFHLPPLSNKSKYGEKEHGYLRFVREALEIEYT